MHEDVLPGLHNKVDIVDAPLLGIWLSSTHVIERIKARKSVRYLVPDPVVEYIREHEVYNHQ
jgi:nicotinic acid mononucleotide adenylyltransferase